MSDDNGILSIDAILSVDDIKHEVIDVPEWGGSVKVKVFTKAEQQAIRRAARSSTADGEIDVDTFERLVVTTGLAEPYISDGQYTLLLEKSAPALQKVVDAIMRINGMSEDADKEQEAKFQN